MIGAPLQLPNLLVLDVESARLTARNADSSKVPIAVIGMWGLRDLAPYLWVLDGSRFPRMFITERDMDEVVARYDGVVTWNGLKFDGPCCASRTKGLRALFRRRHIDLLATCCLLAAGVPAERLATNLDDGWHKLTPTLRQEFLNAGWHLGAVGAGTLGVGKLAGPQGAQAVEAWNDGLYSSVISYNLQDVALTRALFIHAWTEGFLNSEERGRVDIPREALR